MEYDTWLQLKQNMFWTIKPVGIQLYIEPVWHIDFNDELHSHLQVSGSSSLGFRLGSTKSKGCCEPSAMAYRTNLQKSYKF
jgi:hypothetical protein